ncbi:MAG: VCBS repeat-containing protein, partial [Chloroflexi bacterium]|nr:VCBS repeat-containing protein [Chloroflexota bacterium]
VNRLFRQEADGRFTDVTLDAGLGDPGYGMGVAVGDVDNDGDRDVYVANLGPDKLYVNLGDGTFAEVTAQAGVQVDGWSSSVAFLDYDGDGFLDIYITRYVKYEPAVRCTDIVGRPDYCGPLSYTGVHDVLLHNNADGTFTDVSEPSGIARGVARGLGVVCEDFNDDGRPDIFVANDGDPNHLWINQGEGRFEPCPRPGARRRQHLPPRRGGHGVRDLVIAPPHQVPRRPEPVQDSWIGVGSSE